MDHLFLYCSMEQVKRWHNHFILFQWFVWRKSNIYPFKFSLPFFFLVPFKIARSCDIKTLPRDFGCSIHLFILFSIFMKNFIHSQSYKNLPTWFWWFSYANKGRSWKYIYIYINPKFLLFFMEQDYSAHLV